MTETADLRERMASVSHDVEAIDRVLERLGYSGDIQLTPRAARVVLFYRGELRAFLVSELRKAGGPLTSRELAERIAGQEGKSIADRRMMVDITRRVSKGLRQLRDAGQVTGGKEGQGHVWRAV